MANNIKKNIENRIEKFKNGRFVKRSKRYLSRLILPGFQKVPFLTAMEYFVESLKNGILVQRAATITYRMFITIIPIFMALFAAVSFLDESLRIQLIHGIESVVPDYIWPAIENMIKGVIMKQNGVLLIGSFITGLYLTVLTMNSVITSLNLTYYKIETRSSFKQLLVSLLMILAFGILILLGIGIFIGSSYVMHYIDNQLFDSGRIYSASITLLKWVLLLILSFLLISLFYYFAPADKKYFRFFSAGSIFSTIMLVLLLFALNIYFHYFSNYNVLYGSIGALFAILLWLNWSAMIILIGFDLNVSIFVAKQKMQEGREPQLEDSYAN